MARVENTDVTGGKGFVTLADKDDEAGTGTGALVEEEITDGAGRVMEEMGAERGAEVEEMEVLGEVTADEVDTGAVTVAANEVENADVKTFLGCSADTPSREASAEAAAVADIVVGAAAGERRAGAARGAEVELEAERFRAAEAGATTESTKVAVKPSAARGRTEVDSLDGTIAADCDDDGRPETLDLVTGAFTAELASDDDDVAADTGKSADAFCFVDALEDVEAVETEVFAEEVDVFKDSEPDSSRMVGKSLLTSGSGSATSFSTAGS